MRWSLGSATSGRSAKLVLAATLVVVACVLVAAPWLPGGVDLYVHVVWAQQVMRCLAAGQPPLWLPDLNAGFGSPGIRLYSPLGPVLDGSLGLLLGAPGRGLRAGAVLAFAALAVLLLRERGNRGLGEWLLVLASPMVIYDLWGRTAWSEVLAIPLLWWLLEEVTAYRVRPLASGVVLALLWLMHAPSTLMAGLVVGAAVLADRGRRQFGGWLVAAAVAAGLTAWHWLPLVSEMADAGSRGELVEGIFAPARNVLGSASAHGLDDAVGLGWIAVGLLAACLAGGWWRREPRRTVMIAGCVLLAAWPARPLWSALSPLAWLQFPWRLLLPATLLAARPLLAGRGWRRAVAAVCLLAPLALLRLAVPVPDPHLRASDGWVAAGMKVHAAMGGNPLLVDAAQNRPPSWEHLGANLARFGEADRALVEPMGTAEVVRWSPLKREVVVESPAPAWLALRLLAYPGWGATVDERAAAAQDLGGVVAVSVPAGRHVVRVDWAGSPWSRVGLAAAVLTALGAALSGRRRPGMVVGDA